jgi:hypothetical protein
MRGYAAMTAPEVLEFARTQKLDITDIYAPTQSFVAAHTDLDEEEIEYALTVVAAEDALELAKADSSAACVLAFEIPSAQISAHHDMSVSLNAPLTWESVECLFEVHGDSESLTWYAPQEIKEALSASVI